MTLSSNANHSIPSGRKHIPALDGVRGLAILLVLSFHTGEVLQRTSLPRVLRWAVEPGWSGVDLFFILSGFLITGILIDSRDRAHYYRNFYMRRFLRIFPLYYAVLACVVLIGPRIPAVAEHVASLDKLRKYQLWFWLYGSNILLGTRDFFSPLTHFWSLAIEEQFYLSWPFLVAWLQPRRLVAWIGVLFLTAFVARTLCVAMGLPLAAYYLTPCRLDGLAVGSFLAVQARKPAGLTVLRRPALVLGLVSVGILVTLLISEDGLSHLNPKVQIIGYSSFVLLYGSLLVWVLTSKKDRWIKTTFEFAPFRFIGKISYGIYVYHMFIILFLFRVVVSRHAGVLGPPVVRYLVLFLGTFAASSLVAYASWRFFEKPILGFKKYFESAPVEGPVDSGGSATKEAVAQRSTS